jgi:hypothetical protein
MDVCADFVRIKYFSPCSCGSQKRHFCIRQKQAYCHECHPERASHSIKVYRNMHRDVIRVPTENYGDIRTFRCNGRYVVNIRPVPTMTTSSLYTTFCLCGRGIVKKSKYCSIQCLTQATAAAEKTHVPQKRIPCRRQMKYLDRRRKSTPQRSYVM